MPTTNEHIEARDDQDLLDRLIAAAEQMGVADARSVVATRLGALISHTIEVNGQETSITAVHAYAAAVRREHLADSKALPPGKNPGAVTDDHLRAALLASGVADSPSEV